MCPATDTGLLGVCYVSHLHSISIEHRSEEPSLAEKGCSAPRELIVAKANRNTCCSKQMHDQRVDLHKPLWGPLWRGNTHTHTVDHSNCVKVHPVRKGKNRRKNAKAFGVACHTQAALSRISNCVTFARRKEEEVIGEVCRACWQKVVCSTGGTPNQSQTKSRLS